VGWAGHIAIVSVFLESFGGNANTEGEAPMSSPCQNDFLTVGHRTVRKPCFDFLCQDILRPVYVKAPKSILYGDGFIHRSKS
jgi:hypothetical protein